MSLPDDVRKKGSRLTNDQKKVMAERKLEIQKQFKRRLGLIVDTPKQGYCF